MDMVQHEVPVQGGMHWDLLLILILWEEFQQFTATARSNGLFRKDSETSTDIQRKPSAAHLRFISEETTLQMHQHSAG